MSVLFSSIHLVNLHLLGHLPKLQDNLLADFLVVLNALSEKELVLALCLNPHASMFQKSSTRFLKVCGSGPLGGLRVQIGVFGDPDLKLQGTLGEEDLEHLGEAGSWKEQAVQHSTKPVLT